MARLMICGLVRLVGGMALTVRSFSSNRNFEPPFRHARLHALGYFLENHSHTYA